MLTVNALWYEYCSINMVCQFSSKSRKQVNSKLHLGFRGVLTGVNFFIMWTNSEACLDA